MNGNTTFTLADLEKLVEEHESNAVRVKTIINELCRKNGLAERYPAQSLQRAAAGFKIRSDQFHARPLATCVKEYLELRRNADLGPAAANEIFDSLVRGGFSFGGKTETINRSMVYNALTKNQAFYKLPNKQWGLREWYPNAKPEETEATIQEPVPPSADTAAAPHLPGIDATPTDSSNETNVSKILKALAGVENRTLTLQQIVEKTGRKKNSLSTALFALQRKNKVKNIGQNTWTLKV